MLYSKNEWYYTYILLRVTAVNIVLPMTISIGYYNIISYLHNFQCLMGTSKTIDSTSRRALIAVKTTTPTIASKTETAPPDVPSALRTALSTSKDVQYSLKPSNRNCSKSPSGKVP